MKQLLLLPLLLALALLVGCVAPAPPLTLGNFPESPIPERIPVPRPKDGDTFAYRVFSLVCHGKPIYTARVSLLRKDAPEGKSVRESANYNGTYEFWIPPDQEVCIAVEGGIQDDLVYAPVKRYFTIRDGSDRDGSAIEIQLEGRYFDGTYLKQAHFNTATTPPRRTVTFHAANRFVPFTTPDARQMVYDRVLNATWYYPTPAACTYAMACEEAQAVGGEVPTLAQLITLFTPSREVDRVYLHPLFAKRLQDARVWVSGGKRCVVFGKRYAPSVNPRQPEGSTLILIPGDRRSRP
ncbi:MAG: hypothetical protein ACI4YA_05255 [Candidatus Spyradenecus sp.]